MKSGVRLAAIAATMAAPMVAIMAAGWLAPALAGDAGDAGDAGAPQAPALVVNPAGPPLVAPAGSPPLRIIVPVDIGAAIAAWRQGEMLVNQSRSGVRYNQRPARLLFYCETPFTLEVTAGEGVAGRPAAYDAGNTRACRGGEGLYASASHGLFCQAVTAPVGAMPRDPNLRAYSEILLGASPALALLGVCVGPENQVLPAQIGDGSVVPAQAGCAASGSAVRYNGQGRAGYTDCPR